MHTAILILIRVIHWPPGGQLIKICSSTDIAVSLNGSGNVHIENLESDNVLVETENGNLTTKSLKTHNLVINTRSGTISTEGVLQGNLFVTATETVTIRWFIILQKNIQQHI